MQRDGIIHGCSPSPGAAIIAVYKMESNSIYTDNHYLNSFVHVYYSRYVDDNNLLAPEEEDTQQICDQMTDQCSRP